MGIVETSLECRLLCASQCAKGINLAGKYEPEEPYHSAVDWDTTHPPVSIVGGPVELGKVEKIDAVLIGANNDGIIMACRGTLAPHLISTETLLDWWQDIFVSQPVTKPGIPGKVDKGFWNAIDAIWDNISQELKKFQSWFPDAPLFITGHSKGGPMASLSAARIHFLEPEIQSPKFVCTFASPHPGNVDFVNAFPSNIPVTRFENHLDIVPFLPPTENFYKEIGKIPLLKHWAKEAENWDYQPVGELNYVNKHGKIEGQSKGLTSHREEQILVAMITGIKKIADAHHISCGSHYLNAVCPGELCDCNK